MSVGNATKGFATYGCCHPCYVDKMKIKRSRNIQIIQDQAKVRYKQITPGSVTDSKCHFLNIYKLSIQQFGGNFLNCVTFSLI